MTDSGSFATPSILLLVFNRPDLTERVFEAIREVKPGRLYVAADGPRADHPGEQELCDATRALATSVDWECDVHTLFRHENLGCRDAVSGAISWFFDHEEAGIILEDDCLPDPSFFPYCAELLERYTDEPSVGMISGDCFWPDRPKVDMSYVAIRYAHIWGWATWRRAWRHYDPEIPMWRTVRGTSWLQGLCDGSDEEAHYWATQFDRVMTGELNTWDFQWVFTCWRQDAACIVPTSNLISNIGFGTNGTHTRDSGIRSGQHRHPADHFSPHPSCLD